MCAHQWVFLPDFFTQLPSVFFPKCPLGYQWPPDFQILGCFPGRASLSFPWHLSLPITPESTWPPGPKALPLPLYFCYLSTSVTPWLASHHALSSCYPPGTVLGTGDVTVHCAQVPALGTLWSRRQAERGAEPSGACPRQGACGLLSDWVSD